MQFMKLKYDLFITLNHYLNNKVSTNFKLKAYLRNVFYDYKQKKAEINNNNVF